MRLGATIRDWNLLEKIGQGRKHEYTHELLEGMRVYWHDLLRSKVGGYGASTRQRTAIRDLVMSLPCEPVVMVAADGRAWTVPLEEVPALLSQVPTMLLLPVHWDCPRVESDDDPVGVIAGG